MQPYVIVPSQGSDQEDEWVRLGVEAHVNNKLAEAQKHYQQALRLNPRNAIATQNLAIVFAQSNLLNEALLTIERATLFDTTHGVMLINRAFMCLEADRIDEAITSAERAVALYPLNGHVMTETEKHGYIKSRLSLAMVLATAGRPAESLQYYQEMLAQDPAEPVASPNSCFVQTLTTATPADLLASRKAWYVANGYKGEKKPHTNDRTLTRPLRVGYVGGDFKTHSASMIFGQVVRHHRPDQVIPYLYSSLPLDKATDVRSKLFHDVAQDRFRDITTMQSEDVDKLIRQDQIDILVDLAGHTNGGRLLVFTRKPAPIQISAWGFAHGTGIPEMDYFLADPVAVPLDERQYFTETIVDVPCIVSYDAPTEYGLKGTSILPYYTNDHITFGCSARYEKLSESCLQTFAEILRLVPDSTLQFKDHAFRRPYSIKRVYAAMPDIAPERLLFSISSSHQDHMLAYQQADLCLDPFPHGGGVVALEQLYMGVPLLTYYGSQPSGRTAASVLTAMNRTEWIAKSREEYRDKAVALTQDVKALAAARKTLRKEFLESPVVAGYPEAIEAAYRTMWEKWCTKSNP